MAGAVMTETSDPHGLKRPHAVLDWAETGPVAVDAGDVYFSAEDGLAETRSVFLQAAGFPERFNTTRPTIVGELGFGTGLNFLALWDLFVKTAPRTSSSERSAHPSLAQPAHRRAPACV